MSQQSDGVIHSLQQRRELEEAVVAMAATETESALIQAAQQIVGSYPHTLIQPVVLKHLGTSSGQLRGGLGHVCALLPSDTITPVLLRVVGNRQKAPQDRTTAALILGRFLGEPPPEALLADLAGSNESAYQSLLEAVEEGRKNRHILYEYVTQMQQHSLDVAFMVMGLLDQLPGEDQVELLRLIGQDGRRQVARAAIERLSNLARTPELPGARRALHTLSQTLPQTEAAPIERTLRKLQFGGLRYVPPTPENWRSLISPAGPGGFVSVWLVRGPDTPSDEDGILLSFVVSIFQGAVQFSGSEDMAVAYLPPPQALGSPVMLPGGGNDLAMMLEVPFDVGRWFVQQGLQAHWQHGEPEPLAGEYTLYSDLIRAFAPPQLPEALATLWRAGESPQAEQPDLAELADISLSLVHLPVMSSWLQWGAAVWSTLEPMSETQQGLSTAALTRLVLRELGQLPDQSDFLHAMAVGLQIQAIWFGAAGDEQSARGQQRWRPG